MKTENMISEIEDEINRLAPIRGTTYHNAMLKHLGMRDEPELLHALPAIGPIALIQVDVVIAIAERALPVSIIGIPCWHTINAHWVGPEPADYYYEETEQYAGGAPHVEHTWMNRPEFWRAPETPTWEIYIASML